MLEYRPLADRVIVEKDDETLVTKSGIYLVKQDKNELQYATVLAVGPGKVRKGTRVPVAVSVGDRIAYEVDYGTDITLSDGTVQMLIHESDIVGIVE